MRDDRAEAAALMEEFAARTGVGGGTRPQRYLWTDAFAVINLLALDRADAAAALIDDVHRTLGRQRSDAPRRGWLSGLAEQEGAEHPTRGGLRIGKPLPERAPDEPFDEALEWSRDGQYFHYLTRWMDALSRAAAILDQSQYQRYAVELAAAVVPRFVRRSPSGQPLGLAWKMSIDLSRPLVDGINPHDALDGYTTLRTVGRRDADETALRSSIDSLRELSSGRRWGSADPLGIGGLLMDALRLACLPDRSAFDQQLLSDVLAGADAGLAQYLRTDPLGLPPSRRLAFRELGLAIGLQGLPTLAAARAGLSSDAACQLESLEQKAAIGSRIIDAWRPPQHRAVASWVDHRDINDVMLCSALLRAGVETAEGCRGQ